LAQANPKPKRRKPKTAAQASAKSDPTEQALLLGQFGDWAPTRRARRQKGLLRARQAVFGRHRAGGRPRDPSYAFISTRPAEKVKNEVSVIVGYTQKPNYEASRQSARLIT